MNFRNKFYLLRHGQTDHQDQKKGLIYPADCVNNIPLSLEGISEVRKTARQIKKIDLIYSSDFLRTRQTAEIVKEETHYDKPIIFDSRLRDVNLGIWHGKKKKDFYEKFPIDAASFSRRPQEGESPADVEKRMFNFLFDVDSENEDKKILIISHRDPLWLLLGKIRDIDKEEMLKIKKDKSKIKTAELIKLN